MPTEDPAGSGQPSLRADGLRNRHRILAVARELFARRSPEEVQLEDIAAAAGVAQATLFRHVQSKAALIDEIYQERVLDLGLLVEGAMRRPTGWEGFVFLLRGMARGMHEDRGLYGYSVRMREAARIGPGFGSTGAALQSVIQRAQDEGALRADVGLPDILPLLGFTVAAPADRLDASTDILLAGLRATR